MIMLCKRFILQSKVSQCNSVAGTDKDTEKHPHAEVNGINHSDNAVKDNDM